MPLALRKMESFLWLEILIPVTQQTRSSEVSSFGLSVDMESGICGVPCGESLPDSIVEELTTFSEVPENEAPFSGSSFW